MLALFGTSLPVAHVAPASTGSITPDYDLVSLGMSWEKSRITYQSSISPHRLPKT